MDKKFIKGLMVLATFSTITGWPYFMLWLRPEDKYLWEGMTITLFFFLIGFIVAGLAYFWLFPAPNQSYKLYPQRKYHEIYLDNKLPLSFWRWNKKKKRFERMVLEILKNKKLLISDGPKDKSGLRVITDAIGKETKVCLNSGLFTVSTVKNGYMVKWEDGFPWRLIG